jgi:hypothetical protein
LRGRSNGDRRILDVSADGDAARCGYSLPFFFRRKQNVQETFPNGLQARPHFVGLVRGDLAEGVVDTVDQTLGTRFVDLELALDITRNIERSQRQVGPADRCPADRFGAAPPTHKRTIVSAILSVSAVPWATPRMGHHAHKAESSKPAIRIRHPLWDPSSLLDL